MPRPFTAHREGPAIVAEAAPLFSWAREQAEAVAATLKRAEEERKRLATVDETVEESMEFSAVEEAAQALADAKKAALEDDPAVADATKQLAEARAALKKVAAFQKSKAIKKSIKALVEVATETKDRISTALATGRVPNVVEDVATKTARQIDEV